MLARRVALSLIFAAVASASFCDQNPDISTPKRVVSKNTRPYNVLLHWATDPARALAALFATILREGLNYEGVVLVESHYTHLEDFAKSVKHVNTRKYEEIILALAIDWEPGHNPIWVPNNGAVCGLAGPRLQEFGSSPVQLKQHLHVYVAEAYKNKSQCNDVTQWDFYTNATVLKQCGFSNTIFSNNLTKNAMVYYLDMETTMVHDLNEFVGEINFESKYVNRTNLFEMLRSGHHSFLFMDYDIWAKYERNILIIPQPFCLPTFRSKCLLDQSTAVSMRVGDLDLLEEHAPEMLQLAFNLPQDLTSPEAIREVLELESEMKNIEQAAYEWVLKHNSTLDWAKKEYSLSKQSYDIAAFYCINDPYFNTYDELLDEIYTPEIMKTYESFFQIQVWRYKVDCSDINYIKSRLVKSTSGSYKQRLIGAVVGNLMNITDVASLADGFEVPLLFYDAAELQFSSNEKSSSEWLATGNNHHLALAIRKFSLTMNWKRIAVFSEPTERANRFLNDLKVVKDMAFGDHSIPLGLSESEALKTLKKLQNGPEEAHIILLNTNYKDAATILAAAATLEMGSKKNYAWIVREWQPNDRTSNIRHFTFSFWCRCSSDVSDSDGLPNIRTEIDKKYPNCTWPPHAATLGDAIFTLINGFKAVIEECPQARNDLRNEKAIERFQKKIVEVPTKGVTQTLKYKGRALEETLVFIEEWYGDRSIHLARYRINASAIEETNQIKVEYTSAAYPPKEIPEDGSSSCLISSGDPYLPSCHDWEWAIAAVFLLLLPPTLILVYRVLRRRLKEHEKMIICKVLAQRQQRAAALSAGYLVDRSALSLRRELGSGRFGYVRLAWLRLPGKTPQYVAAKSLRDNNHQDESEILHEACVLASLHHENIVRLVGVCIDKDPPLILMEVAFFGDLLQYLRDRRYLVEEVNPNSTPDRCEEEATHVSAEALTRLARQAASALGYLAQHGVIHRDLRASNCLVDANRTLKLADFGLARETKAVSSDVGAEYACRRRGLFPVLWMAPESLSYGIFSPASDVWSFGVLVYELVTLGARPYGDMSPLRVMQYVTTGGKPIMPRDATPQTVALTKLCWQREPEQRPTAANVMAYLTDRPNALCPAFDSDSDAPTDVDSGFGESPMSEFLPC